VRERLERLEAAWREVAQRRPVAKRLEPWARTLLGAARESLTCRLERQAGLFLDRVQARLDDLSAIPLASNQDIRLEAAWNPEGLPKPVGGDRQERVWRRVRSLRAARLPFQGEHHPGAMGLAWGPYNRQSAVAEALKAAARLDPLWVDDFLEREKAMRTLDGLLGVK
jgi:hypothetical protein